MRKKLGEWILDVAKYLTTAGLIAPFLVKAADWTWYIYVCIVTIVAVMVVVGLLLSKEKKTNK
ncbi:MAG: hypothetical protein J6T32_00335 [Paludibacteraceae bacterium]|nr:hypothetical protein [Paludibacteraceae bacterium]